MNKNRKSLRYAACCMAAAITLGSLPSPVRADIPVAGVPAIMSVALADNSVNTFTNTSAGISSNLADCVSVAVVEAEAAGKGKKSE